MEKITVGKYTLDNEQSAIVYNNAKHILVVAGAGSGKTLTILGKIYYLVNVKNILPEEILCISFTKASSDSLREKIKKEINLNLEVYTFHKLSLNILKSFGYEFDITDSDMLETVINEFFTISIYQNKNFMKLVLDYFEVEYKPKKLESTYRNFCAINVKKFQMFERLIACFLHLFKCNGYSLNDFNMLLKEIKKITNFKYYKKEKIFLILTLNIYLKYNTYLENNNEIDFDDMIIKAGNLVKDRGIKAKYKYVIIDEYQDASFIRFNLVNEIISYLDASLMVVGDDFQSIYKFTGCDLSLFVNFKDFFPDADILKIQSTYRNSQELISKAGDFVMRNKKQIRKTLVSSLHLESPIVIVKYNDIKEEFIKLVEKIYKDNNKNILVLGRNNKDINMILSNKVKVKNDKVIYLDNEDINITYMTVHKSKGLEEDVVILINLVDSITGFPSKLEDDRVLRLVQKSDDTYPYSEERRLFYVALTRTKSYIYLLVPKKNPSIFIKEF